MTLLNVGLLVDFVVMSIAAVLVPFVFRLRYRYYRAQFALTAYQKRFQIGWPLLCVGAELTCIGAALCMAWLQGWPPFSQEQWQTVGIGIFSFGMLCFLIGLGITADGFAFLRARSRHTATHH